MACEQIPYAAEQGKFADQTGKLCATTANLLRGSANTDLDLRERLRRVVISWPGDVICRKVRRALGRVCFAPAQISPSTSRQCHEWLWGSAGTYPGSDRLRPWAHRPWSPGARETTPEAPCAPACVANSRQIVAPVTPFIGGLSSLPTQTPTPSSGANPTNHAPLLPPAGPEMGAALAARAVGSVAPRPRRWLSSPAG
jgi:hypothetical protein